MALAHMALAHGNGGLSSIWFALPVAYLPFPGEGHGFRQAETVKRALEAELYFYGRIFGFDPADPIEPVDIEGLA